jgi:hypothetical protein
MHHGRNEIFLMIYPLPCSFSSPCQTSWMVFTSFLYFLIIQIFYFKWPNLTDSSTQPVLSIPGTEHWTESIEQIKHLILASKCSFLCNFSTISPVQPFATWLLTANIAVSLFILTDSSTLLILKHSFDYAIQLFFPLGWWIKSKVSI